MAPPPDELVPTTQQWTLVGHDTPLRVLVPGGSFWAFQVVVPLVVPLVVTFAAVVPLPQALNSNTTTIEARTTAARRLPSGTSP